MKKILTLCVATYNMEKYLDRCLSSVTSLEINSKLEILELPLPINANNTTAAPCLRS